MRKNGYISRLFFEKIVTLFYNNILKRHWYEEAQFLCRSFYLERVYN